MCDESMNRTLGGYGAELCPYSILGIGFCPSVVTESAGSEPHTLSDIVLQVSLANDW